jgi:hypothetical protein
MFECAACVLPCCIASWWSFILWNLVWGRHCTQVFSGLICAPCKGPQFIKPCLSFVYWFAKGLYITSDSVSTLNGYISILVYHLISHIWLDRCNLLLLLQYIFSITNIYKTYMLQGKGAPFPGRGHTGTGQATPRTGPV